MTGTLQILWHQKQLIAGRKLRVGKTRPMKLPDAQARAHLHLMLPDLREAHALVVSTFTNDVLRLLVQEAHPAASFRQDSVFDTIRNLFASITARFGGESTEQAVPPIAAAINAQSQAAVRKQMLEAVRIDVFAESPGVVAQVEDWTKQNIALIKSVPPEHFKAMEELILRQVRAGMRPETIREEMQKQFNVSANKAALIARDQTLKLFGTVNRARHEALGILAYFWRTVKDGRVRSKHAAREGNRYLYSDPPADGNPGQPVRCRCTADPDIEEALGG